MCIKLRGTKEIKTEDKKNWRLLSTIIKTRSEREVMMKRGERRINLSQFEIARILKFIKANFAIFFL